MCTHGFEDLFQHIHSSVFTTLTHEEYTAEVVRRRTDSTSVYVRLTGLCGAVHLNGREGLLTGPDPKDPEGFGVCLAAPGTYVSVRSHNYELVHRPKHAVVEGVLIAATSTINRIK
jgi:hypothetical protein